MSNPFSKVQRKTTPAPLRAVPEPEQYAGTNYPYRGIEQHGVPGTPPPELADEWPNDNTELPEYAELDDTPIPVRIVNKSTREYHSLRTGTLFLQPKQTAQMVGRDRNRTKITFTANLQKVYFGAEPNVSALTGVEIIDTISLTVQDAIYIINTGTASAEISYYLEFVVTDD